ncbi:M23 family metallopeptidase [Desertihabitans brevis]|uniref:M23 family metallopeptidase n=1 Tax=Desertihabitans brevis TaxID=2268447 RepID=UPI0013143479|nr:M23 family metallopeptidase [Desertihabitans brevis]
MSRTFRGAKARRALAADDASFSDRSDTTRHSILSHGLAALAISVLGLGVAGSVSLTSAAQATQVDAKAALNSGSADTSRAEPAQQAVNLNRDLQAAAQANEREQASDAGQSNQSGTLDSFSGRDDRESRNSVRVELDRAIAAKELADRQSNLSKVDEKVVQTSRQAMQDERAEKLAETSKEIESEDARIKEEEKKKAEAEKKRQAEESASGTLSLPEDYEVEPVAVGDGGGVSPLAHYRLAARWGAVGSWSRYHTGTDLSAPIGTPIRAAADGVVVPANGGGWAGTHVIIKHADGSKTLYAHMASTAVSPGQQVKAGTMIGVVGMTGRTFGPHLHFEWYPAGASTSNPYETRDPAVWMLSHGVRL